MDTLQQAFKNESHAFLLDMLKLNTSIIPRIFWTLKQDFYNDFIFINNKVEYIHERIAHILRNVDL